jgi:putative pyruvate formate lyase activating enzyme
MPDLKYGSDEAGMRYSGVPDYWTVAREALREMHRQVGDLRVGPRGIARQGLLIRHLVLPGDAAASRTVVDFVAGELSAQSALNIMDQYRPEYRAQGFPELARRPTREEHASVSAYARQLGLRDGAL